MSLIPGHKRIDVGARHGNTRTCRDEYRCRNEDDYYEYAISVPSAGAIAYVDMDPPTVYDPYQSHGEDDDADE